MATKVNNKGTATKATGKAKAPAKAAPKAAPAPKAPANGGPYVQVLGVPAKPYRPTSQRGQYWGTLVQYHGQPLAAWVAYASTTDFPGYMGAAAQQGTPHNPMVWFNWFAKQGVVQATQQQPKGQPPATPVA